MSPTLEVIVSATAELFFPRRETLGLDARELSPGLVERIAWLSAEPHSYHWVEMVLKEFGHTVSDNTTQRMTGDVGCKLADRRDALPTGDEGLAARPDTPLELVVLECDGGHFRMREPGHGPGGHVTGEFRAKGGAKRRMPA